MSEKTHEGTVDNADEVLECFTDELTGMTQSVISKDASLLRPVQLHKQEIRENNGKE